MTASLVISMNTYGRIVGLALKKIVSLFKGFEIGNVAIHASCDMFISACKLNDSGHV